MTWGQLIVLCIILFVCGVMISSSIDDVMDDIHDFKEEFKKWKK